MRLLRITAVYPSYLELYIKKNQKRDQSYQEAKKDFVSDFFSWADSWSVSLRKIGYESEDIFVNVPFLQEKWYFEKYGQHESNVNTIVLSQIKEYRPDIIWYDLSDSDFLSLIKKSGFTFIKLYVGWVGSAMADIPIWRNLDVILSCAPESVMRLKEKGLNAIHLNHAFDQRVLKHICFSEKTIGISFSGSIVSGKEYHEHRKMLLDTITKDDDIFVCAQKRNNIKLIDIIKVVIKRLLFFMFYPFLKNRRSIKKNSFFDKLAGSKKISRITSDYTFQKRIHPPVFGLEMYQLIADSKVALNIHADSSPLYASNVRMFEVTGVGSCLLTDWKQDIKNLFDPETEIVTYRSSAECLEKIRWLFEHEGEREEIAKRGHLRCLKDHTFDKRVDELDFILRTEFRKTRT